MQHHISDGRFTPPGRLAPPYPTSISLYLFFSGGRAYTLFVRGWICPKTCYLIVVIQCDLFNVIRWGHAIIFSPDSFQLYLKLIIFLLIGLQEWKFIFEHTHQLINFWQFIIWHHLVSLRSNWDNINMIKTIMYLGSIMCLYKIYMYYVRVYLFNTTLKMVLFDVMHVLASYNYIWHAYN